MNAVEALTRIRGRGVIVRLDEGRQIDLDGPDDVLTDRVLDWIRAHKSDLVEALESEAQESEPPAPALDLAEAWGPALLPANDPRLDDDSADRLEAFCMTLGEDDHAFLDLVQGAFDAELLPPGSEIHELVPMMTSHNLDVEETANVNEEETDHESEDATDIPPYVVSAARDRERITARPNAMAGKCIRCLVHQPVGYGHEYLREDGGFTVLCSSCWKASREILKDHVEAITP